MAQKGRNMLEWMSIKYRALKLKVHFFVFSSFNPAYIWWTIKIIKLHVVYCLVPPPPPHGANTVLSTPISKTLNLCSKPSKNAIQIVTRLRTGRSWIRIPVGASCCSFRTRHSWFYGPTSFLNNGYQRHLPGVKQQGREVDHSPQLVPRRRISAATHLRPLRTFWARTGITLPLSFTPYENGYVLTIFHSVASRTM
jgi:hypothetical protein